MISIDKLKNIVSRYNELEASSPKLMWIKKNLLKIQKNIFLGEIIETAKNYIKLIEDKDNLKKY